MSNFEVKVFLLLHITKYKGWKNNLKYSNVSNDNILQWKHKVYYIDKTLDIQCMEISSGLMGMVAEFIFHIRQLATLV